MAILKLLQTLIVLCQLAYLAKALVIKSKVEKSCIVDTDQGRLDLSSLAGKSEPAFSVDLPDEQGTMFWNPCTDVAPSRCPEPREKAEMTYGSTIGSGGMNCETVGTKMDADFMVQKDLLILKYKAGDVTFICNKTAAAKNALSVPSSDNPTIAVLSGPGACIENVTPTHAPSNGAGSISTGTIISISLLVLIILYLVGGVLVMKFVKKAEGTGMIPNKGLWKALPGVVKDGLCFVVKCGKANALAYDGI